MITTQNHDPAKQSKWLLRWGKTSQPKLRLFCFPFAGGGAFYYRQWVDLLAPEVEVCGIQLPGRENRHGEPRLTSMNVLIPILARTIKPLLNVPFCFFGHSMGGMIAFELSRHLRTHYKMGPTALFISATTAPQLPRHKPLLHVMSDDELLQELIKYGGTPKEVLQDKDMIGMMLPLLRADCTLFETYAYTPDSPLECPIVVFGSAEDERATEEELRGWKEQSSSSFSMHNFPGGHFFLKTAEQRNNMLQHISQALTYE